MVLCFKFFKICQRQKTNQNSYEDQSISTNVDSTITENHNTQRSNGYIYNTYRKKSVTNKYSRETYVELIRVAFLLNYFRQTQTLYHITQ